MTNIAVLGAGMVGSAIAIDLAKNHRVTLADISLEALERAKTKSSELNTLQLDVSESVRLKQFIRDADLVISAVPGNLGFKTLHTIISEGKNVTDISFTPENPLDLHDLAIENDVTAIVDCGVAPGMDNILLGYHNERMIVTDFLCMVGGLPKTRKWPFAYKAPFSPVDVIEEYTRPARYVENGSLVTREPLTDAELFDFAHVGTLEAFNTDGLRTLIQTMPHIPNMKEKTLRYPGHAEYIRVLKASGFFSKRKIRIGRENEISPLEFTSGILFDEWKLGENEEEITVMRVMIQGTDKEDRPLTLTYDLYDEYCKMTNVSSMARTTGYTAAAAANLLLSGLFREKGVIPPEHLGKDQQCFDYLMNYQKERGVEYRLSNTEY
jgi:lysine 6-dehydrogenase